MSETNFTEQDRFVLINGFGMQRTKAGQRAIAEIDSLLAKLAESEKNRLEEVDQHHALQEVSMNQCDSLRAQLGEAQRQREHWTRAAQASCEIASQRQSVIDTLRSEKERLRSAVAWAYQMVGARWPNEQVLDNLSDVLAGRAPRHEWPCVPPQSDETERLREALRLIQWTNDRRGYRFCGRCSRIESSGKHAPDCEVGAALAGEPASVALKCPTCGHDTQPTWVFCANCGEDGPALPISVYRYRGEKAQSETGSAA